MRGSWDKRPEPHSPSPSHVQVHAGPSLSPEGRGVELLFSPTSAMRPRFRSMVIPGGVGGKNNKRVSENIDERPVDARSRDA
ncbi:hypothetical protein SPHINGO391_450078 [Sphingomonas aurantiaca]|uniref:Uncharacterized protein n=1 Tax=Sphingomonas aurantiaca TaxID=185949 RepID=A0A5E7ZE28_9SPHN|nr:hypothetical protein SPHINGO391_450078 [Sphingomonas aurantiaca]